MYLTCGARLQLRLGLVCEPRSRVLMTHVSSTTSLGLRFENASFLPHLSCFLSATPWLLVPYLFSGSSSSSAAHGGPDSGGSSSPEAKDKINKISFVKETSLINTHNKNQHHQLEEMHLMKTIHHVGTCSVEGFPFKIILNIPSVDIIDLKWK